MTNFNPYVHPYSVQQHHYGYYGNHPATQNQYPSSPFTRGRREKEDKQRTNKDKQQNKKSKPSIYKNEEIDGITGTKPVIFTPPVPSAIERNRINENKEKPVDVEQTDKKNDLDKTDRISSLVNEFLEELNDTESPSSIQEEMLNDPILEENTKNPSYYPELTEELLSPDDESSSEQSEVSSALSDDEIDNETAESLSAQEEMLIEPILEEEKMENPFCSHELIEELLSQDDESSSEQSEVSASSIEDEKDNKTDESLFDQEEVLNNLILEGENTEIPSCYHELIEELLSQVDESSSEQSEVSASSSDDEIDHETAESPLSDQEEMLNGPILEEENMENPSCYRELIEELLSPDDESSSEEVYSTSNDEIDNETAEPPMSDQEEVLIDLTLEDEKVETSSCHKALIEELLSQVDESSSEQSEVSASSSDDEVDNETAESPMSDQEEMLINPILEEEKIEISSSHKALIEEQLSKIDESSSEESDESSSSSSSSSSDVQIDDEAIDLSIIDEESSHDKPLEEINDDMKDYSCSYKKKIKKNHCTLTAKKKKVLHKKNCYKRKKETKIDFELEESSSTNQDSIMDLNSNHDLGHSNQIASNIEPTVLKEDSSKKSTHENVKKKKHVDKKDDIKKEPAKKTDCQSDIPVQKQRKTHHPKKEKVEKKQPIFVKMPVLLGEVKMDVDIVEKFDFMIPIQDISKVDWSIESLDCKVIAPANSVFLKGLLIADIELTKGGSNLLHSIKVPIKWSKTTSIDWLNLPELGCNQHNEFVFQSEHQASDYHFEFYQKYAEPITSQLTQTHFIWHQDLESKEKKQHFHLHGTVGLTINLIQKQVIELY
ncbi:hypothetical protein R4Z10_10460 [Niallia sp. XMNu-256]|uniref:hypothetical protein n=1 Tax=Niallia sp. XMNu-256 TaxID=3082444 RepID=UPI0030D56FE0